MAHTSESVATLKRTELQSAAVATFGKFAAAWTPSATNVELRAALVSGEVPERFRNGNGHSVDLAAAIAAAIGPLMAQQIDVEQATAASTWTPR